MYIHVNTIAAVTPMAPKKGAYTGHISMLMLSLMLGYNEKWDRLGWVTSQMSGHATQPACHGPLAWPAAARALAAAASLGREYHVWLIKTES